MTDDDLVVRLRRLAQHERGMLRHYPPQLIDEAADELDRLRARLVRLGEPIDGPRFTNLSEW